VLNEVSPEGDNYSTKKGGERWKKRQSGVGITSGAAPQATAGRYPEGKNHVQIGFRKRERTKREAIPRTSSFWSPPGGTDQVRKPLHVEGEVMIRRKPAIGP